MSRTPEPRPALQKAPDGGVHPAAAPRTSAPMHLHPAPQAPVAAAGRTPVDEPALAKPGAGKDKKAKSREGFRPGDLRARKAAKSKQEGPSAVLKVDLPKDLRKAARKKAERGGYDLDAVVASLLRAWVDS